MPYSNRTEVETWAQVTSSELGTIGYDYNNTIQYIINLADRAIDDYCDVPEGFFEPGGVEIQNEYHDGVEVGEYNVLTWFNLSLKRRPFLRLNYTPVLSVTKLEEEVSADSWSTRTEGRNNDYLVMENGIRYLRNIPKYKYKNIRVTYKAGYATTPGRVNECSARLAAAMLHRIIDSKSRDIANIGSASATTPAEFVGLAKPCFTDELKMLVRRYKRKVPVKLL